MDSGNSGSLQSSSSAELGECDSRSAVNINSTLISTNNHSQQQPPPFNHHMIDHQNQLINNVNPFLFSSSQQYQLLNNNLDPIIWSKTLPAFSDHQLSDVNTAVNPSANTIPIARNPKKRSRASRKAPTTVLTTNTGNFRAMVQEFTGIPAPPFTSSSSVFPTIATSFDLFGRPSTTVMRSSLNNFDNLPQQPSYLSQKLQSLSSSSSSISSFLDSSYLPNTMQNLISFPSNSLDQSPFLNPKTTENHVFSNRCDGIRQTQNEDDHRTTLHDLVTFQQTTESPPEK